MMTDIPPQRRADLRGTRPLITSPQLLGEIASVLKRPRPEVPSTDEALRFVADLATQTILLTDPPGPPAAVCRDPNDGYLVATARHADAIVTDDPDLHADTEQPGIEIMTPRQRADRLA